MAIRRLNGSGLTAGGKLSKLWDQETFPGYMEAIATAVVDSSGASSITFSNIPQTYKHLQVRALTVTNTASSGVALQFNGDTTANYKGHGVYGNGTGAGVTVTATIYTPNFVGGAAGTSPGSAIIDILDYTSTSKNKTVRSLDGYDANGSGYVALSSGLWFKTPEAITSMTFTLSSFLQYAHFALYGLRG